MTAVRIVLAASLLASGCAQSDPYRRAGMWQPEGVNDLNLAAMVANPHDLLRGHGDARPQPLLATAAVRRLLAGTPTPLPSLSGDIEPGTGGSAAPSPGAGQGAGGPQSAGGPN